MKILKISILIFLIFGAVQGSYAIDSSVLMNNIALGAILATLILIAVACLVLLHTFKVLTSIILPQETVARVTASTAEKVSFIPPATPKPSVWEKLLSLRPMQEEKDLLIEHEYDGIRELDNPTPAWFMWLFYISVVFAVTYLLNYHVFKLGMLQEEEYVVEMQQAEVAKKDFLAKSANQVDENSVKISSDAEVLKAGQAIFAQNCVACHGDKGQGIVGPNLTDEFWLHGGKINDLFRTIKYGVPDKGMISWEKQLTPQQISEVASYIKSIIGTNPPNPKAPQGEKES